MAKKLGTGAVWHPQAGEWCECYACAAIQVIGSLDVKARNADTKAQSALDKSSTADTKAGEALTKSRPERAACGESAVYVR
jgi:hypothetical protein